MRSAFYRTIWRWHFYAGLLVMPMIVVLSLTGAAYLFKPQIERWEERDFRGLSIQRQVSPDAQLAAALAANPGARFHAYRLPEHQGDAAMIHLALADGKMRDVFVSPQGGVLGSLDPDARIAPTIARIHGSLLIGKAGDWLVELAASWAIVLVLSGLYLWWPRGRGLAGVVWPRLGKRTFWRDLHAVTGFWVAGLALVLLATGLPWAGVWGQAFKAVRGEMGWVKGGQNWKTGAVDPHAEHDHQAMAMGDMADMPMHHDMPRAELALFIVKAEREHMAFPVLVLPPGAAQSFGPPTGQVWTVKSEAQNRPLQRSVTFDPMSGAETGRQGFADKHPLDRLVNYGIAWHEGALLGWVNQLVGVLTAGMLITLVVSGFVMWRRRRPEGLLGAPAVPDMPARVGGVAAILLVMAILLPLLALSLAAIWLAERLILSRIPAASHWLGLART